MPRITVTGDEEGLRGYDAVQLAAALVWRDAVGQEVILATFDRELWEAAGRAGLRPWPENLTGRRSRPH